MEESVPQDSGREGRETPRVSVVIVTFNSQATVSHALDDLAPAQEARQLQVIVVDNASSDDTCGIVRRGYPWAKLIAGERNLGFGRGCNSAFESVATPYVLFLNPDACLGTEALKRLVEFLDEHEDAGVAVPLVQSPDGSYDRTRPLPSPGTILRAALPGAGPAGVEELRPGMPARRVEWASGAVLLMRTELFRRLGGFDPRFFLYWEETDLLRRARDVERSEVWVIGDALATHLGGASAAQSDRSHVHGDLAEHFYQSRLYYLVKHHGALAGLATEALELVLLAGRELARRALGRGPGKLVERLRGPLFQLPARNLDPWPAPPQRRSGGAAAAVVVIGRNEQERLEVSLRSSLAACSVVVYVDSASSDRSVAIARSAGVDVVERDVAERPCAASSRNVGLARVLELQPDVAFVQFVDGDCELVEGWFERARSELRSDARAAIVCGRLLELDPDGSIYNRLCALEWDRPSGRVAACGGVHMVRVDDFCRAGGFDPDMLAGEEPELCLRLRRLDRDIVRIDVDMAIHDAQLETFGSWWERSVRSGFASAAGCARHGLSPERHKVSAIRSVLAWTVALPFLALLALPASPVVTLAVLALYPIQVVRVRNARLHAAASSRHAWSFAAFLMLAKFAELQGLMRYCAHRRTVVRDGSASP